jgi:hypothetical protein
MPIAPWILALSSLSIAAIPLSARAQCCAGYSPVSACSGASLSKSRWCVQNTVPDAQTALPPAFCAYGDQVITTLEQVFDIPASDTFEFELDAQTGGAHTGTACDHFGNGVAYDAFAGSGYGVSGFWGYLLALHEAINDWTGMSSSGWPTDWWADHQSAFPNLMDFHIMTTLGTENQDPNLIKAAAAQKKRFYPGGDSADAKVVALDNVFAAMPMGDGFSGFSHMFALRAGDGVKWDGLGVGNPDVLRSEYVAAYLSLAAHAPMLPLLQGPGANGGGGICNNTPDGTAGDKPYTCSESHIDAIATAHCASAARGKSASDLSALRMGKYSQVAAADCGKQCPAECACDRQQHCVAGWLVEADDAGVEPAADGGGGGHAGAAAAGGGRAQAGHAAAAVSGGAGGREVSDAGASSPVAGGDSGCSCRVLGPGAPPPFGAWAGLIASVPIGVRLGRRRTQRQAAIRARES